MAELIEGQKQQQQVPQQQYRPVQAPLPSPPRSNNPFEQPEPPKVVQRSNNPFEQSGGVDGLGVNSQAAGERDMVEWWK
jgi:hypothetical protein